MKRKIFCYIFLAFSLMMTLSFVPKKAFAESEDYSAKALYLIDYDSGEVLYEKNATARLPVASIVKLMTIELTLEHIEKGSIDINEKVVASKNASSMGGSQVFIEEGGEYAIGDMLKSAIISSANDASVLLAEKIAGSEENFVSLMNEKASELGLCDTHYVNATGLPANGQFSSAKDTAILLKKVTEHPIYHNYSTIWMDELSHPKGRKSELVNTNKLIRYYEGCDGGKTGSTNEAGYCLSATAKRGNMRLIGSVLGAENGKKRFAETSKLLDYGFNNFENKKLLDKNKTFEIGVQGGKQNSVLCEPQSDLFAIIKKLDKNSDIKVEVKLSENLSAPINAGEQVGEAFVVKNGKIIRSTPILATENVLQRTFGDDLSTILSNWGVAE